MVDDSYGSVRGWVRCLLAQMEFAVGRLDRFIQPEPRQVRRLVFVCLGNINRSAFAGAAALRRGAQAVSIGLSTSTGAPATDQAMRCAARFGLDLAAHTATDISDYEFVAGDLLLVMEIRHVHRLIGQGIAPEAIALLGNWSSPHRIHLHDPHTLSDSYYRSCFALIQSAVDQLVDELAAADSLCMSSPLQPAVPVGSRTASR